jgi:hypothetical protein
LPPAGGSSTCKFWKIFDSGLIKFAPAPDPLLLAACCSPSSAIPSPGSPCPPRRREPQGPCINSCDYTAFPLLRFGVEPPPPLPSSRFFFLSPGAGLSGGPGSEPCSFKAQWGRHVAQQVNGQRQFARTRPAAPLGSAWLRSAPLGSFDSARARSAPFGSAQLRSAPLGSAPLSSTQRYTAPLIALTVVPDQTVRLSGFTSYVHVELKSSVTKGPNCWGLIVTIHTLRHEQCGDRVGTRRFWSKQQILGKFLLAARASKFCIKFWKIRIYAKLVLG